MRNGCRLGWLIDPAEQTIYVYSGHGDVDITDFAAELTGGEVLPGFRFDPQTSP